MRGFGYVENMVNHIFKLMPKTNRKIFEASYSPNVKGNYLTLIDAIPAFNDPEEYAC